MNQGRTSADAHVRAQAQPRPAITISPSTAPVSPSIHNNLPHGLASSPIPISPVPSTSTPVSPRIRDGSRERRQHSRFSLASMTNVLDAVKERVRATSPHHAGKEHAQTAHERSREQSLERVVEEEPPRGRGRERERVKEKSAFGLLSEKLRRLDGEDKPQAAGDGWKEFRKGECPRRPYLHCKY